MYLTVTASPGVRGITVTLGDRLLVVHLYGGVVFMAGVSRGSVCVFNDEELKKAAWLLTRLMDKVGELAKSRYYTFTGPVEFAGGVVKYRPYVTPTSTAEIILSGGVAKAKVGDVKKKFKTGVDVSRVLERYVDYAKKC